MIQPAGNVIRSGFPAPRSQLVGGSPMRPVAAPTRQFLTPPPINMFSGTPSTSFASPVSNPQPPKKQTIDINLNININSDGVTVDTGSGGPKEISRPLPPYAPNIVRPPFNRPLMINGGGIGGVSPGLSIGGLAGRPLGNPQVYPQLPVTFGGRPIATRALPPGAVVRVPVQGQPALPLQVAPQPTPLQQTTVVQQVAPATQTSKLSNAESVISGVESQKPPSMKKIDSMNNPFSGNLLKNSIAEQNYDYGGRVDESIMDDINKQIAQSGAELFGKAAGRVSNYSQQKSVRAPPRQETPYIPVPEYVDCVICGRNFDVVEANSHAASHKKVYEPIDVSGLTDLMNVVKAQGETKLIIEPEEQIINNNRDIYVLQRVTQQKVTSYATTYNQNSAAAPANTYTGSNTQRVGAAQSMSMSGGASPATVPTRQRVMNQLISQQQQDASVRINNTQLSRESQVSADPSWRRSQAAGSLDYTVLPATGPEMSVLHQLIQPK